MFYVYVLRNEAGKLYIGYSADLRRRMGEHLSKSVAYRIGGCRITAIM